MKTTEEFKKVIKEHLDKRAAADASFAERYNNSKKSIDECITYILNTVQKSGCNGFADEEIYGMAAHYYDEEKLEVGSRGNCSVVINHRVELTEEEKKEAKEKARQEFERLQLDQLRRSEERRQAREKKKEERLKRAADERAARQKEFIETSQPTLF